jgi:hypothetical protein
MNGEELAAERLKIEETRRQIDAILTRGDPGDLYQRTEELAARAREFRISAEETRRRLRRVKMRMAVMAIAVVLVVGLRWVRR